VEIKRQVLVFGDTRLLRRLAAVLRDSPRLAVIERDRCDDLPGLEEFRPDVVIVDGAQVTPEQFHELLVSGSSAQSTLISIDPLTYQLTVLSSAPIQPLTDAARVIEILSLSLHQPD
jgi:hypothetical protein